jgi:hypothetical protein
MFVLHKRGLERPTESHQEGAAPGQTFMKKTARRPRWGRSVLSWMWAVKHAHRVHQNLINTLTALAKTDINAERSAPFSADSPLIFTQLQRPA